MPFGDYKEKNCGNPECAELFKPVTPWQDHCCDECRYHCKYLRTVIPRRLRQAEARLAALKRRKDADPEKVQRLEIRLGEKRRKSEAILSKLGG